MQVLEGAHNGFDIHALKKDGTDSRHPFIFSSYHIAQEEGCCLLTSLGHILGTVTCLQITITLAVIDGFSIFFFFLFFFFFQQHVAQIFDLFISFFCENALFTTHAYMPRVQPTLSVFLCACVNLCVYVFLSSQ